LEHLLKGKKSGPLIKRGSTTDAAYVAIRKMIVYGRLAPGSWIGESDLAHLLQMSRTPIREALQWLQHEGYVLERKSRSKSRMMVAPLTLRDAHELYAIVGRIEGLAGLGIRTLDQKQQASLLTKLRKLNSELTRIADSPNPGPEEFADIDTSFHDEIVEACAGPRLLSIYKAIKPQTDRYWRLYSNTLIDDMTASCREHDAIVDGVAKGSGEATERALQINWENGAERLIRAIIKFGERGVLQ
jgi:DNA-binding GntR family transcriptional regulator